MNFLRLLFPYRTHLEAEIEYLHAQLAQAQRHRDALEAVLAEIAKPQPKVYFERKPDGAVTRLPVQPVGWDAYRLSRRAAESQAKSEGEAKENKDNA